MKKEQWTVIGLLVALLGLEVVRSQNVRGFFTGAWSNFQTALNNASNVIPGGLPTIPGGSPINPPKLGNPVGSNFPKNPQPTQKPVVLPPGTGQSSFQVPTGLKVGHQ